MESLKQIKERLEGLGKEEMVLKLKELESDERKSVQNLVISGYKKIEALEKEEERIKNMREFEKSFGDFEHVCGIDEVGRGPLAGPVVVCAIVMPKDKSILYVNDSKKLSLKKREELYDKIMSEAISVKIGIRDHEYIDKVNIRNATIDAMTEAVNTLCVTPDIVLVDALTLPGVPVRQENIIKGDAKSYSIACASIVAKVTRDRMMVEFAKQYDKYGFERNMGYGTKEHIDGLKKYGKCPIHRESFIGNFV